LVGEKNGHRNFKHVAAKRASKKPKPSEGEGRSFWTWLGLSKRNSTTSGRSDENSKHLESRWGQVRPWGPKCRGWLGITPRISTRTQSTRSKRSRHDGGLGKPRTAGADIAKGFRKVRAYPEVKNSGPKKTSPAGCLGGKRIIQDGYGGSEGSGESPNLPERRKSGIELNKSPRTRKKKKLSQILKNRATNDTPPSRDESETMAWLLS